MAIRGVLEKQRITIINEYEDGAAAPKALAKRWWISSLWLLKSPAIIALSWGKLRAGFYRDINCGVSKNDRYYSRALRSGRGRTLLLVKDRICIIFWRRLIACIMVIAIFFSSKNRG